MKTNEELVSIIIPFFNGEKYLKNCITSVLNQDYEQIEVVFINDGSTDNSEIILKEHKNSKIKIITQKNAGVSAARNNGIKQASGKYIAFMDVDDRIEKNYISSFVKAIKKSGSDVCICNYIEEYSDHSKEVKLPFDKEILNKEEIKNLLLPPMIFPLKNETAINGLVWRTFTTRDFIQKNKIDFDTRVSVAEDLLFVIQLYSKANSICVVNKALYHYNKNNNSAVNKYRENLLSNQKIYHKIFFDVISKENLYKGNEERYALHEMRRYTSALSNIARNPRKKSRKEEIKLLYDEYKKEKIIFSNYQMPKLIRLTNYLLKKKRLSLLLFLYSIKEYHRIKKLKCI